MPALKIPKCDYDLILELLKTLSRDEVAEKWEVSSVTISRVISECDTSIARIVRDYRIQYMIDNPLKTVKELAVDWGVTIYCVYDLKRTLRKGILK